MTLLVGLTQWRGPTVEERPGQFRRVRTPDAAAASAELAGLGAHLSALYEWWASEARLNASLVGVARGAPSFYSEAARWHWSRAIARVLEALGSAVRGGSWSYATEELRRGVDDAIAAGCFGSIAREVESREDAYGDRPLAWLGHLEAGAIVSAIHEGEREGRPVFGLEPAERLRKLFELEALRGWTIAQENAPPYALPRPAPPSAPHAEVAVAVPDEDGEGVPTPRTNGAPASSEAPRSASGLLRPPPPALTFIKASAPTNGTVLTLAAGSDLVIGQTIKIEGVS